MARAPKWEVRDYLRGLGGVEPPPKAAGLATSVGASTRGSTTRLCAFTLMTPYPVGVGCTLPLDMATVYDDASDTAGTPGGSMAATANAVAMSSATNSTRYWSPTVRVFLVGASMVTIP